jgi:CBS domain containing-hemolysin-like protein
MDALVAFAIIVLLVLANAVFVAAEFAIVGAPRATIEHHASQGSRLAQRVSRILDNPRLQDRYIATTQIGISVASLGLGMYGEHVLADWIAVWLEPLSMPRWIAAHALASGIAIALLTYLHIVVGEMVPKALALQSAQTTVLFVSPLINALEVPIRPLVIGLNAIGNGLLRAIGIRRQEVEAERLHTTEELQYIIRESQEGGLLRGEAGQILRELFEFGDLTARQVMVPRVRVIGIPLGADAGAVRATLRDHPFTRYPVYETSLDRIVGMLHVKDILRCLPTCTSLDRDLVRAIPFLPSTTSMDQVIAALRQARTQMAVVMDEHGGTAGILTVEDLFEEVVGDVADEAQPHPEIVREANGCVRVRGTTRLEALSDALDVDLEHEDVDTVSGLTLALLGGPPSVGDAVVFRGVRIEVTAVEGRGVAEVVARRG